MFQRLQNARYMQYLCAMTAAFTAVAGAMHTFWTSPALIILQSADSPIGRPITDDEGSWIVSLLLLSGPPSAILGAWLVERIGRKHSLQIGSVLITIPWFMIMFTKSIMVIYLARFIGGFGGGIALIGCTLYLGEIAENDIRGKITTILIVFKLAGSLLVLCIGPYLSYVYLAIMCASVSVLYIILCIFIPESPYYLVKSNKVKDAEERLRFLSSKTAGDKFIRVRMMEIENCIREDMKNRTTVWEFLTNPDYRRAIFIMFGVKTLHQFSGIAAIDGYMQTIIGLSESNISEEVSSMIFGLVQVPAAIITSLLVDKVGRKPIWIVSAFGCAIALFAEGIFFYFQNVLEADVSSIAWIPTVGIALFLIMISLGIVPLPYVLLSEIFPANIKGISAGATTLYGVSIAFLVTKFFMPISNLWGLHTVFFIFALVCVLGAIFIIFALPETKGKSFSEIQAIMKHKRKDKPTKNLS